MLKTLVLKNFRGFREHLIPFVEKSLIIGPNNAGKSTIVEALRIIELVLSRHKTVKFEDAPSWAHDHTISRGVMPSLAGLDIKLDTLFHGYDEGPALIQARFSDEVVLSILLSSDANAFACIEVNGVRIAHRAEMKHVPLPTMDILPQVAPLNQQERVLQEAYVKKSLSSQLSPQHFRNQLFFFHEYEAELRRLVEDTWPGVRIKPLRQTVQGDLHLLIQDGDFVGEVASMGHGLQIWLQVLWFLARASGTDILVLDEPDVYLHADMQRKLMGLLHGVAAQRIIATHSVEMLGQADPRSIIVINRKKPKSRLAASLKVVQQAIDRIGGIHNIHLARVWSSKVILLVEGEDLAYLREFQRKLFPATLTPFDALPSWSIGGWGGWNLAIGSATGFKNAGGEDIRTYCILDRDFHSDEIVQSRLADAVAKGVLLHVWQAKEIENYLIVPSAIKRAIEAGAACRGVNLDVDEAEISAKVSAICEGLKETVRSGLLGETLKEITKDSDKAVRLVAQRLDDAWAKSADRVKIVSGKEVIARLAQWSQAEFKVSLSPMILARHMAPNELAEEVRSVVTQIEKRRSIVIPEL